MNKVIAKSFKLLMPASLLLLSGCAQMVTKTYSPQRGGVVMYDQAWFMGDKNREKAMTEMNAFCSPGRPTIVREDNKLEATGRVYNSGSVDGNSYSGSSTQEKSANVYLHFKCSAGNKKVARK